MPNKILVAVDSSAVSQLTARWALLNFAREHDTVYLVGVTPPMAISMGANPAPIASAGAVGLSPDQQYPWGVVVRAASCRVHGLQSAAAAPAPPPPARPPAANPFAALLPPQVAALAVNWEQQRKQEEELCRDMLHKAGGWRALECLPRLLGTAARGLLHLVLRSPLCAAGEDPARGAQHRAGPAPARAARRGRRLGCAAGAARPALPPCRCRGRPNHADWPRAGSLTAALPPSKPQAWRSRLWRLPRSAAPRWWWWGRAAWAPSSPRS